MYQLPQFESLRTACERHGLASPRLHIIDVGVSGGLHSVWREWGDDLVALGIDALENEVQRLQSAETNPQVVYEAARVSLPPDLAPAPQMSNYLLHRSAAYLGTYLSEKLGADAGDLPVDQFANLVADFVRREPSVPFEASYSDFDDPMTDHFYSHYQRLFQESIGIEEVIHSPNHHTLDEIVSRHNHLETIDLLKIDTDGFEMDVLRGAEETLSRGCLFVEVEVQFHGPIGSSTNVFCNIDSFLRARGFSLLKLESYNYSRSALPRPFMYPELPAQTHGGPIQWGDALYFRDFGSKENHSIFESAEKARVAAMVLDVAGLQDVAAEILLRFPHFFPAPIEPLLDVLARNAMGKNVTFAELVKDFLAGVKGFRKAA